MRAVTFRRFARLLLFLRGLQLLAPVPPSRLVRVVLKKPFQVHESVEIKCKKVLCVQTSNSKTNDANCVVMVAHATTCLSSRVRIETNQISIKYSPASKRSQGYVGFSCVHANPTLRLPLLARHREGFLADRLVLNLGEKRLFEKFLHTL